jgi:hypothetical protein
MNTSLAGSSSILFGMKLWFCEDAARSSIRFLTVAAQAEHYLAFSDCVILRLNGRSRTPQT